MFFYYKKLWLYLILLSLFTSIVEAERGKSLDDYYLEVEKSAKKIGYSFDDIESHMNEIDNFDAFIYKDLSGTNPKWHLDAKCRVGYGCNIEFNLRQRGSTTKAMIRNIPVKGKDGIGGGTAYLRIELGIYRLSNFLKESPQIGKKMKYFLKERMVSDEDMRLVMEDLRKYENKIRPLIINNIVKKVVNLIKGTYSKEDYFISGKIDLIIDAQRELISIINSSESDLYSKKSDLLAIFDEYQKNGFCRKIVLSNGEIKYESLKNKGKYKGYILIHKGSSGVWATPISGSEASENLSRIRSTLEDDYENFVQIAQEYRELALEKIINKYTQSSNDIRLGNEF